MATTTTTSTGTTPAGRVEHAEGDQRVVLSGVGWSGYRTLLHLRGERSRPRMLYLDGNVSLMSPSFPHEYLKSRLGIFVTEVVSGLVIPFIPSSSTTFRRRLKQAGVEPVQSYYLASATRIRGKSRTGIHLRRDPPPDLAIEVARTHDADASIEVYRRFGVPEVWVWEGEGLRILVLGPDGDYIESETSASFPFLTTAEIAGWIQRPESDSETDWLLDVRRWVREVLAPRVTNRNP